MKLKVVKIKCPKCSEEAEAIMCWEETWNERKEIIHGETCERCGYRGITLSIEEMRKLLLSSNEKLLDYA